MYTTQNTFSYEELNEREKALQEAIYSMERANSSFDFLTAQKRALLLFQEQFSAPFRLEMWNRYRQLCDAVRENRAKPTESESFLSEKIETAIQQLEKSITAYPQNGFHGIQIEEIKESQTLGTKNEIYREIQGEIHFLTESITVFSSIKKEIVQAELPVYLKRNMFKKLSHVSDSIFPQRRELIEKMSALFKGDVEEFLKREKRGVLKTKTETLFTIREEIKRLQDIAKIITLNADVFETMRYKLAEYWDEIRAVIITRKKEGNKRRAEVSESKNEIGVEIDECRKQVQEKNVLQPEPQPQFHKREKEMVAADPLSCKETLLCKAEKKLDLQIGEKKETPSLEFELQDMISEYQLDLADAILSFQVIQACQERLQGWYKKKNQLTLSQNEHASVRFLLAKIDRALLRGCTKIVLEKRDGAKDAFQCILDERDKLKKELELHKRNRNSSGISIATALALDEEMIQLKEKIEDVQNMVKEIEKSDQKATGI